MTMLGFYAYLVDKNILWCRFDSVLPDSEELIFGRRKLFALFKMAATVRLYKDLAKAFLVAFA